MSATNVTVRKNESPLAINYVAQFTKPTGKSDVLIAKVIGTLQHSRTNAQIAVEMSKEFTFNGDISSCTVKHPEIIGLIAQIYQNHIKSDPELKDPRFHPVLPISSPANPSEHSIFTENNFKINQIAKINLGAGVPILEFGFDYKFTTLTTDPLKWRIDFNGTVKHLETNAKFPLSVTAEVLKTQCVADQQKAAANFGERILNGISKDDPRFVAAVDATPETAATHVPK